MCDDKIDQMEDQLLRGALALYKTLLRNIGVEIWANPQVRFVEYHAHDLLTKVLEEHEFTVTRNYILPTGFRAEYSPKNSRNGPNVCFICEYDALPEVGHACGHNLIAESGIAMALLTKYVMTLNAERYPGKITVIGTPAEEGGGGKIIMLDAFDDVDVAMMLHASNKGILHTETLCSSRIYADYTSNRTDETSHHFHTIDTMGTGSDSDAAITAYNSIISLRSQIPHQWRIGVIIREVDDKLGLEITYRTERSKDMASLRTRIVKCLEAGAKATYCELTWRFTDPYVDMWPNLVLGNIFGGYLHNREILFEYGLEKGYNAMVSTDMGNVSQKVPSIHPMFYIDTHISLHHPDFARQANTFEAEKRMLDCAQAVAHTALRLLRCPEELLQAKKEFLEKKTKIFNEIINLSPTISNK